MLQILRSNQLLVVAIIVIYAVLLHLYTFLLPENYVPGAQGILSEFMYSWLDVNSLLARIISIVLLIVQALMINRLVNFNKIAKPFSYFPAGFYLLFTAYFHQSGTLTPILMANTFYLAALLELYKIFKKNPCTDNIFNIGFWVAIAGLFYFSMNIFLIFGFLGLLSLRSFKLNEVLILLIGFLVPYFLLGTYFFWTGQLGIFWQKHLLNNIGFLNFDFDYSWQFYTKLGLLGLFTIISFANFQNYISKRTIQSQKYIKLLFTSLFVSLLSIFIQKTIQIDHFMILSVPLTIFLGMAFLAIKNRPIAEFFFIILLLIAFGLQYNHFF